MDEKKLNDIVLWSRIGCITVKLSRRLNISQERALGLLYNSKTLERFRNHNLDLYLMSDTYLVNDVIAELRERQG